MRGTCVSSPNSALFTPVDKWTRALFEDIGRNQDQRTFWFKKSYKQDSESPPRAGRVCRMSKHSPGEHSLEGSVHVIASSKTKKKAMTNNTVIA